MFVDLPSRRPGLCCCLASTVLATVHNQHSITTLCTMHCLHGRCAKLCACPCYRQQRWPAVGLWWLPNRHQHSHMFPSIMVYLQHLIAVARSFTCPSCRQQRWPSVGLWWLPDRHQHSHLLTIRCQQRCGLCDPCGCCQEQRGADYRVWPCGAAYPGHQLCA